MALQLRPNCEYCDKDLPPDATDARICTYECTFCADCVDTKLHNVCPNCGGGFQRQADPSGDGMAARSVGRETAAIGAASAFEVQPRRHRGAFGAHPKDRSGEALNPVFRTVNADRLVGRHEDIVVLARALKDQELARSVVLSVHEMSGHRRHGATLAGIEHVGRSWRPGFHHHRSLQAHERIGDRGVVVPGDVLPASRVRTSARMSAPSMTVSRPAIVGGERACCFFHCAPPARFA